MLVATKQLTSSLQTGVGHHFSKLSGNGPSFGTWNTWHRVQGTWREDVFGSHRRSTSAESGPERLQDPDGPTGFEGLAGRFDPIGVKGPAGTVGESGIDLKRSM